MSVKVQDPLDQQSIDIINNAVLGNFSTVTYKPSTWDIDKLHQFAELSLSKAITTTLGITIVDGEPKLIPHDDIVPVKFGETYQPRVGANIHLDHVNELKADIDIQWSYSAKLPIVEKLKKPIKKPDGSGYYYYRLVEGRHRFEATSEYKDFPCYVVEGHESIIELVAQKSNNPSMTDKKLDNDEESVKSTIRKQIVWYRDTKGKYGVKADRTSIVSYLKEHFPHIQHKNRKRFADLCLADAGILADLEDLTQVQIAKLLRDNPHLERVNDGTKDSRGRVGIALRRGRKSEEFSAYIAMAESLIEYYKKDKYNIPTHYFIGSFTMGSGVGNQPTTHNMDIKRVASMGCFLREFVREIVLPLSEMWEEDVLHEPDLKYIAQNNGKGETPSKLY